MREWRLVGLDGVVINNYFFVSALEEGHGCFVWLLRRRRQAVGSWLALPMGSSLQLWGARRATVSSRFDALDHWGALALATSQMQGDSDGYAPMGADVKKLV